MEGNNLMKKQAIIYARFSPRPDADECTSCEKQVERCRIYCERNKYDVMNVHMDKAVSGGFFDRPGLRDAVAEIQMLPGRILVVDRNDRLARDMLVSLTIRQAVAEAGGYIEYADGSPPGTTAEGELLQNIMAAFAAYERSRIRLRTKLGLEKIRKAGLRTTSRIPIGWKLDPADEEKKRLIVCEHEKQAIIDACKMKIANKMSSEEITGELNKREKLCRGNLWGARTVRKVLQKYLPYTNPIDGILNPNDLSLVLSEDVFVSCPTVRASSSR